MLESAASPLAHEFKAPKAAPSSTSPERPSGKNFTPLSTASKGEQIDRLVQDAVKDSEKEIAAAKARTGKAASVETPPSPMHTPRPTPPEVPQLPPGVSPEAFAQIQGDMASGAKTQEQALAELEQMVTKATGAPPEVYKPAPIKKPVEKEKTVSTAPKASSAPLTTSAESRFPALQKLKNMFGKVWDSITSFLKGITSWITK